MKINRGIVILSGLLIWVLSSSRALADIVSVNTPTEEALDFFQKYGLYLGAALIAGLAVVAYMAVKKRKSK
ncbi:hypothetical protein AQUSIP_08840 [Aquicella siphonis]|uniref:Uncharacterized protein n=1 Tax=Aquicella siphonis TaxID=254247 RepID=A0A5E4PFH4_9COXI|nr:hypothetical protein [Aquicella siphonis]VVC75594.1 hypothetical protein AQUSIP_08840 [Aquicella siphonis]